MSINLLPTLNAVLNGTSALFLVTGLFLIRKKKAQAHGILMSLAFLTSILFLVSYLTYHALHGSTHFPGRGPIRPVYFAILISHTILAVVIVPLAIRTLFLAVRSRLEEHRRIARWAFPIWLYVSVTGVIVYWMLYRVNWALGCPMCQDVVASTRDLAAASRLTGGFAWSLGLLLCTPYLLFAGITFLIVRSARRSHKPSS
ncbi:MAG: DUF420 domain-containing protein [Candidatus Omnitrophica bacterium]|nr:DUF420 domain-containing protein [Candidatus Omnitrophota bacterium]